VNVLFPILPFSILLHCVHHANVYPSFVGFFNTISSLSTVYVLGFVELFSHPFISYVISYVCNVQFAVTSLFHVDVVDILFGVHPLKSYPLFVGSANDITHTPYV
jgi:hypothetical protein